MLRCESCGTLAVAGATVCGRCGVALSGGTGVQGPSAVPTHYQGISAQPNDLSPVAPGWAPPPVPPSPSTGYPPEHSSGYTSPYPPGGPPGGPSIPPSVPPGPYGVAAPGHMPHTPAPVVGPPPSMTGGARTGGGVAGAPGHGTWAAPTPGGSAFTVPSAGSALSAVGGLPLAGYIAAAVAGLVILGWLLPIFGASSDLGPEGLTMSDKSGESWGLLVMGLLAGLGAIESLACRRHHGLSYSAGVLLAWMPFMLVLIAAKEVMQDQLGGSSFSSGPQVSWGSGGVMWMLAMIGSVGVFALAGAGEARTLDRVDLPSPFSTALYVGSGLWVLSLLLPSDGMDIVERLFGGPFLVDVAALLWAVGMAVLPVLAARRPTVGVLAATAGLASAWACYWAMSSDSSGLVSSGALAGEVWAMVSALVVVGIASSLSVVWRPGTPFVIDFKTRWWPWVSLSVVSLFSLVGMAR